MARLLSLALAALLPTATAFYGGNVLVTVVRATGLPLLDEYGIFSGDTDAYVRVTVGSQTRTTKTARDDLDPFFAGSGVGTNEQNSRGETLTLGVHRSGAEVKLTLVDGDSGLEGADDVIGKSTTVVPSCAAHDPATYRVEELHCGPYYEKEDCVNTDSSWRHAVRKSCNSTTWHPVGAKAAAINAAGDVAVACARGEAPCVLVRVDVVPFEVEVLDILDANGRRDRVLGRATVAAAAPSYPFADTVSVALDVSAEKLAPLVGGLIVQTFDADKDLGCHDKWCRYARVATNFPSTVYLCRHEYDVTAGALKWLGRPWAPTDLLVPLADAVAADRKFSCQSRRFKGTVLNKWGGVVRATGAVDGPILLGRNRPDDKGSTSYNYFAIFVPDVDRNFNPGAGFDRTFDRVRFGMLLAQFLVPLVASTLAAWHVLTVDLAFRVDRISRSVAVVGDSGDYHRAGALSTRLVTDYAGKSPRDMVFRRHCYYMSVGYGLILATPVVLVVALGLTTAATCEPRGLGLGIVFLGAATLVAVPAVAAWQKQGWRMAPSQLTALGLALVAVLVFLLSLPFSDVAVLNGEQPVDFTALSAAFSALNVAALVPVAFLKDPRLRRAVRQFSSRVAVAAKRRSNGGFDAAGRALVARMAALDAVATRTAAIAAKREASSAAPPGRITACLCFLCRDATSGVSSAVAWALWFFAGPTGAAHLYLSDTPAAVFRLCLFVALLLASGFGLTFTVLPLSVAVWVRDAHVLGDQIEQRKAGISAAEVSEIKADAAAAMLRSAASSASAMREDGDGASVSSSFQLASTSALHALLDGCCSIDSSIAAFHFSDPMAAPLIAMSAPGAARGTAVCYRVSVAVLVVYVAAAWTATAAGGLALANACALLVLDAVHFSLDRGDTSRWSPGFTVALWATGRTAVLFSGRNSWLIGYSVAFLVYGAALAADVVNEFFPALTLSEASGAVFFGHDPRRNPLADVSASPSFVLGCLTACWLGFLAACAFSAGGSVLRMPRLDVWTADDDDQGGGGGGGVGWPSYLFGVASLVLTGVAALVSAATRVSNLKLSNLLAPGARRLFLVFPAVGIATIIGAAATLLTLCMGLFMYMATDSTTTLVAAVFVPLIVVLLRHVEAYWRSNDFVLVQWPPSPAAATVPEADALSNADVQFNALKEMLERSAGKPATPLASEVDEPTTFIGALELPPMVRSGVSGGPTLAITMPALPLKPMKNSIAERKRRTVAEEAPTGLPHPALSVAASVGIYVAKESPANVEDDEDHLSPSQQQRGPRHKRSSAVITSSFEGFVAAVRNTCTALKRASRGERKVEDKPVEEEDETVAPSGPSDGLPAGWKGVRDEESGDVYYYHEDTGETTWDKPVVAAIEAAAADEATTAKSTASAPRSTAATARSATTAGGKTSRGKSPGGSVDLQTLPFWRAFLDGYLYDDEYVALFSWWGALAAVLLFGALLTRTTAPWIGHAMYTALYVLIFSVAAAVKYFSTFAMDVAIERLIASSLTALVVGCAVIFGACLGGDVSSVWALVILNVLLMTPIAALTMVRLYAWHDGGHSVKRLDADGDGKVTLREYILFADIAPFYVGLCVFVIWEIAMWGTPLQAATACVFCIGIACIFVFGRDWLTHNHSLSPKYAARAKGVVYGGMGVCVVVALAVDSEDMQTIWPVNCFFVLLLSRLVASLVMQAVHLRATDPDAPMTFGPMGFPAFRYVSRTDDIADVSSVAVGFAQVGATVLAWGFVVALFTPRVSLGVCIASTAVLSVASMTAIAIGYSALSNMTAAASYADSEMFEEAAQRSAEVFQLRSKPVEVRCSEWDESDDEYAAYLPGADKLKEERKALERAARRTAAEFAYLSDMKFRATDFYRSGHVFNDILQCRAPVAAFGVCGLVKCVFRRMEERRIAAEIVYQRAKKKLSTKPTNKLAGPAASSHVDPLDDALEVREHGDGVVVSDAPGMSALLDSLVELRDLDDGLDKCFAEEFRAGLHFQLLVANASDAKLRHEKVSFQRFLRSYRFSLMSNGISPPPEVFASESHASLDIKTVALWKASLTPEEQQRFHQLKSKWDEDVAITEKSVRAENSRRTSEAADLLKAKIARESAQCELFYQDFLRSRWSRLAAWKDTLSPADRTRMEKLQRQWMSRPDTAAAAEDESLRKTFGQVVLLEGASEDEVLFNARVSVAQIEAGKNCRLGRYGRERQFEDPAFPPTIPNFATDAGAEISPEWVASIGVNAACVLFDGGTDPDDIYQGTGVADGWLLSALSILAASGGVEDGAVDPLVKRLFVSTIGTDGKESFHTDVGCYAVRLYVNGQWETVLVDDLIPCTSSDDDPVGGPRIAGPALEPVVAHSKGFKEAWAAVVEKAYAKYYGGYGELERGFTHHALSVLTGAQAEEIFLSEAAAGHNRAATWSKLKTYHACGYPMGCGSVAEKAVDRVIAASGLVFGAAYTVYDVREVDGHKVVKLRNPPGDHEEWRGDWGDESELWTKRLKHILGWSDADDNTFWMSYDDFLLAFSSLYVCFYTDPAVWKQQTFHGRWTLASEDGDDDDTAVGLPSKHNKSCRLADNPQWAVHLHARTHLRLTVKQCDTSGVAPPELQPCTLFVVAASGSGRVTELVEKNVVASTGACVRHRTATVDLPELEAGTYVVLVGTYVAGLEGPFSVVVESRVEVDVERIWPAPWRDGRGEGA